VHVDANLVHGWPLLSAALTAGHSCGAAYATTSSGRPAGFITSTLLEPGQKGTKQLLEQDGDRLVCVRYRYDAQGKKRFKTVELVVAERDWEPPRPRISPDQIVKVRVAFAEAELRDPVKQAGGTWNPQQRLWRLRYDRAMALGLDSGIVTEPASTGRCAGANPQRLPGRFATGRPVPTCAAR
jgi:hypothetical protein